MPNCVVKRVKTNLPRIKNRMGSHFIQVVGKSSGLEEGKIDVFEKVISWTYGANLDTLAGSSTMSKLIADKALPYWFDILIDV
ncbi:hypothetical protein evm_014744 [Chilo suppressalis]|nr:hypothetical protein evm_014744 [Chilo suppressalis]